MAPDPVEVIVAFWWSAVSWFVAYLYDWLMASTERACLAAWRRSLLEQASGRVIEIGAGTGILGLAAARERNRGKGTTWNVSTKSTTRWNPRVGWAEHGDARPGLERQPGGPEQHEALLRRALVERRRRGRADVL